MMCSYSHVKNEYCIKFERRIEVAINHIWNDFSFAKWISLNLFHYFSSHYTVGERWRYIAGDTSSLSSTSLAHLELMDIDMNCLRSVITAVRSSFDKHPHIISITFVFASDERFKKKSHHTTIAERGKSTNRQICMTCVMQIFKGCLYCS